MRQETMTLETMVQERRIQTVVSVGTSSIITRKLVSALLAVMLGIVIIGAVGFAPGMAHDAAHDTRHVMIFPCH